MSKRKISIFLAICMLFSAFSTVVYADDSVTLTGEALDSFLEDLNEEKVSNDGIKGEDVSDDVIIEENVSADTVGASSGECGDNLTWTLDDNGTLTISGTGEMWEYYYGAPWDSNKSQIKTVIIESGVTNIGDYAFYEFTSLTSVTIPDSVTSIGNVAFSDCTSLTSIIIPDSVTNIGNGAFESCTRITSIAIPDSVTSIGAAFRYCYSLKSVTLPSSITSIVDHMFESCWSLETLTIPSSVTSIGRLAFNDSSLTSIIIPDSVTSIGDFAFGWCGDLESVTIGASVASIGGALFEDCYSLKEINVSADNAYYSSKNGVLFNKNKTVLIYYPLGNKKTSYTIPDSVTSIDGDAFCLCCFNLCSDLESITIPDSVTSIGSWAFYGCDKLTDVYYEGTEEEWNSISVEDGNDSLLNATIHFESKSGITVKDDKYTLEAGMINGIRELTTVSSLSDIISNSEYTVTDASGNVLSEDDLIGTGCVISTPEGDSVTVVIKGDTDGNGEIDATDYAKIKTAFITSSSFEGAYKLAADINNDGEVDATDFARVKSHFLGKYDIYA